jgi:alkylhydroperoxidase family enzyme
MDAVLADWKSAEIPERTRAALRLLECLTLTPMALDESFVQGLREDGLDDPALREAANVCFHFNMINRLSDAFDFDILDARQEALHTKMLNQTGKRLKGKQADPVWIRDKDGQIRPTELARARQPLLHAPGKTTPELRRAVEAFVVDQRGHSRSQTLPIPDELITYLEKLALQAYKITDKDMNDLRTAGYEDEAIYEITVTGAFGAALVGVEKLFEVLYG